MPLIEKIYPEDGIIGLYKMTEEPEELERQYAEIFRDKPSVENFQHGRRKKEWLAVRLLIAGLIGPDFQISYAESGKPQFIHPEYKFISISHSAMYAAVYLHKNKKNGIDVESLDRKFSTIEKKYLSENELEQATKSPVLRAVYWSTKEAIFKWADREGVDFMKQIQIENFEPENDDTISAVFSVPPEQSIELKYLLFDGHVMVYTC